MDILIHTCWAMLLGGALASIFSRERMSSLRAEVESLRSRLKWDAELFEKLRSLGDTHSLIPKTWLLNSTMISDELFRDMAEATKKLGDLCRLVGINNVNKIIDELRVAEGGDQLEQMFKDDSEDRDHD